MSDSPQWIAAKADGDQAELAIAEWFCGNGWEPFQTLGRADFDLLLQCQVEVKRDRKARTTGNVAIETHYRGQPSGILTSTAGWWAIVLDDEALLVKRETLLKLALHPGWPSILAGDDRAATVALLPLDRLRAAHGVHLIALARDAA
jgi:hypothetical protein